jgi:hypothetical protein
MAAEVPGEGVKSRSLSLRVRQDRDELGACSKVDRADPGVRS